MVERQVARAHQLARARLDVAPLQVPGHRAPPVERKRDSPHAREPGQPRASIRRYELLLVDRDQERSEAPAVVHDERVGDDVEGHLVTASEAVEEVARSRAEDMRARAWIGLLEFNGLVARLVVDVEVRVGSCSPRLTDPYTTTSSSSPPRSFVPTIRRTASSCTRVICASRIAASSRRRSRQTPSLRHGLIRSRPSGVARRADRARDPASRDLPRPNLRLVDQRPLVLTRPSSSSAIRRRRPWVPATRPNHRLGPFGVEHGVGLALRLDVVALLELRGERERERRLSGVGELLCCGIGRRPRGSCVGHRGLPLGSGLTVKRSSRKRKRGLGCEAPVTHASKPFTQQSVCDYLH